MDPWLQVHPGSGATSGVCRPGPPAIAYGKGLRYLHLRFALGECGQQERGSGGIRSPATRLLALPPGFGKAPSLLVPCGLGGLSDRHQAPRRPALVSAYGAGLCPAGLFRHEASWSRRVPVACGLPERRRGAEGRGLRLCCLLEFTVSASIYHLPSVQ